jgi:hypothetical protein
MEANIVNSVRKDRTMDEKDKDKIVELKEKADKKRTIYYRGLPGNIGSKNDDIHAMNRAFAEDEMIRKNAELHAQDYVINNEQMIEKFPAWGWFVTGVLFVIMVEVFFLNTTAIDYITKFFVGG